MQNQSPRARETHQIAFSGCEKLLHLAESDTIHDVKTWRYSCAGQIFEGNDEPVDEKSARLTGAFACATRHWLGQRLECLDRRERRPGRAH